MKIVRAGTAVLAWAAGVVTLSAATWLAVDSAGAQLTGPVTLAVPSRSATVSGPLGTTDATGASSVRATATSEPTEQTVTRTTHALRSTSTSTSPSATGRTATSAASSTAATRSGSFTTLGGTMTASCRGAQIVDYQAAPASGWTGTVQRASAGEIDVWFRTWRRTVTLRVTCQDGEPVFAVQGHGADPH